MAAQTKVDIGPAKVKERYKEPLAKVVFKNFRTFVFAD